MPTAGNDSIIGSPDDDTISGLVGDDFIVGSGGADQLSGDAGDDTLLGGRGHDTINGGDGADTIADLSISTSGAHIIVGNSTSLTDTSRDVLSGGDGDDFMAAGFGDTINGGRGIDWALIGAAAGSPFGEYYVSTPYNIAEILGVSAIDIEHWIFLFGNNDDTVYGSSGGDYLFSFGGLDSIEGFDGNDVLIGGVASDTLKGGDGDDLLVSGEARIEFVILGSDLNLRSLELGAREILADFIIGGPGNDTLVGDSFDSLDGGAGFDVLRIRNSMGGSFSGVSINLSGWVSGGANTIFNARIAGVEFLDFVGLSDGNDTVILPNQSNISNLYLTLDLSGGNDHAFGSEASEYIFGNWGSDTIIGAAGIDTLIGGDGADTINGGSGADLFIIDHIDAFTGGVPDRIGDWSNDDDDLRLPGSSALQISIIDSDSDGVHDDTRLVITADGMSGTLDLMNSHISKMGTFDNDVLEGNTHSDYLVGLGGHDILYGRDGGDHVFGGWGDDTIFGEFGDDTLIGGLGHDILNGGPGVDIVSYDSATGVVLLLLDQGIGGSAEVGSDSYIGIERYLLGSGADIAIGSAGSESVDGGAGDDWMNLGDGNDTLNGGAGGADILVGGAGDDSMFGAEGDQFYGGDGIDTINLTGMTVGIQISTGGGWTAFGAGSSITYGIANLVEVVFTGTGADSIYGSLGVVAVDAGAGNDFLADYSGANNDAYFGAAGDDALYGLGGNDLLDGGAGIDIIVGDAGDDTIVGGDGFDWMAGGAGADVFRYTAISHSRASTGTDAVSDFTRGADTIDLAGIDANTLLAGDQAFTIGALQAGQVGRLQITLDPGGTAAWALIQGDVDGDGVADFDILVFGNVAGLTGTDFVL